MRECMHAQIDCFPLPIPCFYTVYAEGHKKPMMVTETSAAFYLQPVPASNPATRDLDIKRSWCALFHCATSTCGEACPRGCRQLLCMLFAYITGPFSWCCYKYVP